MNKIKNGNKGFTLLELLVVVLIIGILAAIALPQYQMAVGKARFATVKDNARVIKSALDRYYLADNNFTRNFEALDIDLSGTISNDKSTINLKDGCSCFIGGDSIFCGRNIFKKGMQYVVEYKYLTKNKVYCMPGSTDTNDKANRLCRLETQKEGTENFNGTNMLYQY